MPLQPIRSTAINLPQQIEVTVSAGQAYVVQLDQDGGELEGFLTSIQTWNKTFSKATYENGNPKFKKKIP